MLGEIDEHRYWQLQSDVVSLCELARLEGTSLKDAERPGHFKELYFCGATMALFSEAAAKEPMLDFLKEVYAGPKNEYDENRYFEVLGAKNADGGLFVKRLATEKIADPNHELTVAFARVGMAIAPGNSPGSYYDTLSSAYALRAVLDPVCLEKLSITGDHSISVKPTESKVCGELDAGDQFEKIVGTKFRTKGGDAWDTMVQQCKKDGFVRVTRKDKPEAKVPCAKAPRARPQYLQVTKAP